MAGYVYILTSQKNGTLYTGVTSELAAIIAQHKCGKGSKFTARYGVKRLVWYEEHFDVRDAIEREKRIKRCRRAWKVALIEKGNAEWAELSYGIGED
ncbi:MAG: GIY-YIG nuclease family protein [Hyphomicrobiales bacterium]